MQSFSFKQNLYQKKKPAKDSALELINHGSTAHGKASEHEIQLWSLLLYGEDSNAFLMAVDVDNGMG